MTVRPDGHSASPGPDESEGDGPGSSIESSRTWPDAIHDAMQICLSLRTPAAILWGDDCRVFHNEAYRESFSVTEPSFGRAAREIWQTAWSGLEPIVADVRRKCVTVWLDGAEADGSGPAGALRRCVSIAPLLDADGAAHAVFCNWPRLDPSRAPATAAGDFPIGAIAHELRNPLGSIANLVEVLRSGAQNEEALATIDRLVDSMAGLVQDLYEEGCRGVADLHIGPFPVADLVRDGVAAAYGGLAARGCSVTVSVDDPQLEIVADRKRLARAITNLLANAARLTSSACKIEVTAAQAEDAIVIAVRDPGLDANRVRPLTFEDDPRLARGGLGLGFWLARRVVLAHEGTFRVDTNAGGGGMTVEMRLPRTAGTRRRPCSPAPLAKAEPERAPARSA